METDYQQLSELYAGFLVAVGSVSITVLTLILILPSSQKTENSKEEPGDKKTKKKTANSKEKPDDKKIKRVGRRRMRRMKHMRTSRTFVVTALLVATVSCFIGAHMMAETSAFIIYSNERLKEPREKAFLETGRKPLDADPEQVFKKGERLFLLASSNIFIAAILVLFALMLIPSASARRSILRVREISFKIFLFVTLSIMYWMVRVVLYRMYTPCSVPVLIFAVFLLVTSFFFYFGIRKNNFWFLGRKRIFLFLASRQNLLFLASKKHQSGSQCRISSDRRFYSLFTRIFCLFLWQRGLNTHFRRFFCLLRYIHFLRIYFSRGL
jgi:hypothetical protein